MKKEGKEVKTYQDQCLQKDIEVVVCTCNK